MRDIFRELLAGKRKEFHEEYLVHWYNDWEYELGQQARNRLRVRQYGKTENHHRVKRRDHGTQNKWNKNYYKLKNKQKKATV